MSKQTMQMLRGRLCKELDEVAQAPELNMGMIDIIHKLTDTIKNIDKIEALGMDGGSEYSRMGYSRGMMPDDGRGGMSYAAEPYAYRGGYSRNGGLTPQQKEAVRKALEMVENG